MRRFELTSEHINEPQLDCIKRLLRMVPKAHMIDVKVRIDGHDEWFEADWIKQIHELPTNA